MNRDPAFQRIQGQASLRDVLRNLECTYMKDRG